MIATISAYVTVDGEPTTDEVASRLTEALNQVALAGENGAGPWALLVTPLDVGVTAGDPISPFPPGIWTMRQIVRQLESCNYQCPGGPLRNNLAFMALKQWVSENEDNA